MSRILAATRAATSAAPEPEDLRRSMRSRTIRPSCQAHIRGDLASRGDQCHTACHVAYLGIGTGRDMLLDEVFSGTGDGFGQRLWLACLDLRQIGNEGAGSVTMVLRCVDADLRAERRKIRMPMQ
ncbi:hypothetical protein RQ832_25970, partial [Roseomonas sp. DSM 102946]|nr:hypothetical protein [Roseomonas sp. DSM 102946]